jgi:hypothetical protein
MEEQAGTLTPNTGRCPYVEKGARCAFRAEHDGAHLMVEWEGNRAWVSGNVDLPEEEWVFHQEVRGSGTDVGRGQSGSILVDVWGKYWNEDKVRQFVRAQRESSGVKDSPRGARSRSEPRIVRRQPRRDRSARRPAPRPGSRGSSRRKGGRL